MFLSYSVRATLNTLILFSALLLLDRQIEKNLRLNFLCKHKTRLDHKEVKRHEQLNEFLLTNILPRHVANHFLTPGRSPTELYHMICPNACILFAAIPNFEAFFSTYDVTGKECLRLLNEIIREFDTVLMSDEFRGIEKVKTIGSTYMAASGLDQDQSGEQNDDQELCRNVLLITRLAKSLIQRLTDFSRDVFYQYQLRIGVSHGKVIAGVVGAAKPQYDIWGDAVNVSSRMESHGVLGRIQVNEATAQVLRRCGVECTFRAKINVKGKGEMSVYLVSEASINCVTCPPGLVIYPEDTFAGCSASAC